MPRLTTTKIFNNKQLPEMKWNIDMKVTLSQKILFIFLIFFITHAYSQNPEWIQYNRCLYVRALVEEGNYVWSGTHTGVYKYDKTTEEYSLTAGYQGVVKYIFIGLLFFAYLVIEPG